MDLQELLKKANISMRGAARYSGVSRDTMTRMDTVGCHYKTIARLTLTCGYKVAEFQGMRKLSECELTEIILPQWNATPPESMEAAIKKSGVSHATFAKGIFWPQSISWPERIMIRIALRGIKWPRAIGKTNISILNEVFKNA